MSFWVDGREIQKSSGSSKRQDAVRLRDQLLGKKARGEISSAAVEKVTCGKLLDDLPEHAKHNIKPSTERIWGLVVQAMPGSHAYGDLQADHQSVCKSRTSRLHFGLPHNSRSLIVRKFAVSLCRTPVRLVSCDGSVILGRIS